MGMTSLQNPFFLFGQLQRGLLDRCIEKVLHTTPPWRLTSTMLLYTHVYFQAKWVLFWEVLNMHWYKTNINCFIRAPLSCQGCATFL